MGIRRFQNEDGTLTPAGKKRYRVGASDEQKKAILDQNKEESKKIKAYMNARTREIQGKKRIMKNSKNPLKDRIKAYASAVKSNKKRSEAESDMEVLSENYVTNKVRDEAVLGAVKALSTVAVGSYLVNKYVGKGKRLSTKAIAEYVAAGAVLGAIGGMSESMKGTFTYIKRRSRYD